MVRNTPASAERTHLLPRALSDAVFRERFGFLWGAVTNVVTTSIAFLLNDRAPLTSLMIVHLLGAVAISTRYGIVVSTFTALTGTLAFDYFCIPPIFAFALPDPHSVTIFAGMIAVALLVCWLNQGLRLQRAAARDSEARTQALCELSISLSLVADEHELFSVAQRHLEGLFGVGTRLVLGSAPRRLDDDRSRIQIVGRPEQPVGYISTARHARGYREDERQLLLAACADRVGDAHHRLALAAAARRAQVEADVERHRNALLSSVSHDLKTPLASILTAGTSLLGVAKSGPRAPELLETIVQEAERMNGLITNLLSVTRLEAGQAAVNRELEGLDDLVFGVLERLRGRLAGRHVTIDAPADLPMVELDAGLVDQLLVNLLENVLRYTPPGSPVDIRIHQTEERLQLDVCDRGPGVLASERGRIFDKFYRGHAATQNDGGTGLGLTICRAIARAHDGELAVLARPGGGSVFRFSIPAHRPLPPARAGISPALQA